MNKLQYFKKHEDVFDPFFATTGSACFDIQAYLTPGNTIIAGQKDPLCKIYTMDNKEEDRACKCWAVKHHSFSVGIDFYPGERILVPTGLIFNIPDGHSVRLHARSSVSLKKGLIIPNGEGIIDSDYYHQTFIMLYNASADVVRIYHGDKIAQGELVETLDYGLEQTETLPEQTTERVGGFGSTGV